MRKEDYVQKVLHRWIGIKFISEVNSMKEEGAVFNDEELEKCKWAFHIGMLKGMDFVLNQAPTLRSLLQKMEAEITVNFLEK